MSVPAHTNRLSAETSPYLLQHAHNPVDWYPWGEEAFEKARNEDKPILLSVGYSACHWCHVMEHESFENESIAAQMNRDFVNVKVDREERPDVDAIYMTAVQVLTGQGGWPMTMFLTPDGKPFYGGTYFPPRDMHGRPGFPRVLDSVTNAWKAQRVAIEEQGQTLIEHLTEAGDFTRGATDMLLSPALLESAFNNLAQRFDRTHGGFGGAPKFPQPANLDFLLRFHIRSKRQEPLLMVEKTLQRMALGGIYDQLGGGFHRYSTDAIWLAPHFEKMLYDNAQLASTYVRTFQATGKPFYRSIAEEILEYVLREMTSSEGGFYSAQDADSEGEEGRFFVWTLEEIREVLGVRDAEIFAAFYNVTKEGNWEGKNILRVVMDAADAARKFGITVEEAAQILDTGRARLLAVREPRIHPALDDKVLTAWNGLALAAFAECGRVCERADFLDAATRNAHFVLSNLTTMDGDGRLRLLRTYRNGAAKLNAYLEDYAFYAEGLLQLFEASGDVRWFDAASQLLTTMIALFWDERESGFYATSADHERLIQRRKDWDDNATPSGNSVALEVLLRMAALTGDEDHRRRAAQTLRKLGKTLQEHPHGFARMLCALDAYLTQPKEVAVIGQSDDESTRALLRTLYATYRPNIIVARSDTPENAPAAVPLLTDRPLRNGQPTAYVCESFVCQEPVTLPSDLAAQLGK